MKFTDREIKILELLAEGKKQYEIAELIGVSKLTLDKHLNYLKRDFEAVNIPNLIYLATKKNYI